MAKLSAGLLLFRDERPDLEVLLVHPGGPFWAKRDLGAWSIPKGEYAADEAPLAAALREAEEELGARPEGDFVALGDVVQAGGKRVTAFAVRHAFAPADLRSNTFELEWPPRSGRYQHFPEVDQAEWFPVAEALRHILPAQAVFIERLLAVLDRGPDAPDPVSSQADAKPGIPPQRR